MQKVSKEEDVLCLYDEGGMYIEQKIVEVFTQYVEKHLQDIHF